MTGAEQPAVEDHFQAVDEHGNPIAAHGPDASRRGCNIDARPFAPPTGSVVGATATSNGPSAATASPQPAPHPVPQPQPQPQPQEGRPAYGAGYGGRRDVNFADPVQGLPPPAPSLGPEPRGDDVWEHADCLVRDWHAGRPGSDHFLTHQAYTGIPHAAGQSQIEYYQALAEHEVLKSRVAAAEAALAEVKRVLRSFAHVEEPVVASDGYTYARATMAEYFDACSKASTAPVSQRTKETLEQGVLVPNRSLVNLVKVVFAAEGPAEGAPAGQAADAPPPSLADAPSLPGVGPTGAGGAALSFAAAVKGAK